MKTIGIVSLTLFVVIVVFVFVMPSFFGVSPLGQLYSEGPAPWALSESDQKKFQFSESESKGRYAFIQSCASCHGPEGKGNGPSSVTMTRRMPSFVNPSSVFKNGLTAEGIEKTLLNGIEGGQMPAYEHLAPQVRSDISAYIQYLVKHKSNFN